VPTASPTPTSPPATPTVGAVYGWGLNNFGQAGGASCDSCVQPAPRRTGGLDGVVGVAASGDSNGGHNLAIRNDGTVWAWGINGAPGNLGDGTNIDRLSPVRVVGLTDVVAIAAVSNAGNFATHSLALRRDGTVWAWGNNQVGQLGPGPITCGVLSWPTGSAVWCQFKSRAWIGSWPSRRQAGSILPRATTDPSGAGVRIPRDNMASVFPFRTSPAIRSQRPYPGWRGSPELPRASRTAWHCAVTAQSGVGVIASAAIGI
jgi:alpha-tubulin suppressor-like RCC1 family protein